MFGIPDPRSLLLYGATFVAIALAVMLGLQTVRLSVAKADLAVERSAWDAERATLAEAAAKAQAHNATLQAQHAAETQRLTDGFRLELDSARSAAADAARSADELRGDIATFLAARDRGAGVDAAAVADFRNRAATLGRLLGDADRLAEKLAGAAERHASEVRALKRQLLADRQACEAK